MTRNPSRAFSRLNADCRTGLAAGLTLLAGSFTIGCSARHVARLQTSASVTAPRPAVLHTGRLLIDLRAHTADRQCMLSDGRRELCYARIHQALGSALRRRLWPSFPEVRLKEKSDDLRPSDYLLLVELSLGTRAPGPDGPGWSAHGRARWRLVRAGMPIAGAALESESPAVFPYGASLGVGASEVVDAIALELANGLGAIPETAPGREPPLPAVKSAVDEPERPSSPAAKPTAPSSAQNQSSDDASFFSMASR